MIAKTANGSVCWKRSLPVEWHSSVWRPVIGFRAGLPVRRGASAKLAPALSPSVQRKNSVKPMKTIGKTIGARKTKIRTSPAFTLVELLVVIAIIGILAAMLLPVLSVVKKKAQVAKAKLEVDQIATAVTAYESAYSRFPISPAEQAVAGANDFTTGLIANPQLNVNWITGSYSFDNNSNVIAILMDLTAYANGAPTVNVNHQKNPKQTHFLTAKPAADTTQPGVGPDGVYRDPWGNPYVITMNTSYNDQGVSDLFYSQQSVSQRSGQTGFNGLFNPVDAGGGGNHFLFHGKVMVWSAGPDRQIANNPANQGVNKDNVLSWQ